VRRQADALDRQAHAPPHLHRDHRERDRDSQASSEHVIQKGVARIVVFLAVAAKAFLLEEKRSQPVQRTPSAEGARTGARGQIVEAGEPGLGLEVGILDAGDRQRGPAQVDLRVGPPQEVAELSEGISSPGRDGSPPS